MADPPFKKSTIPPGRMQQGYGAAPARPAASDFFADPLAGQSHHDFIDSDAATRIATTDQIFSRGIPQGVATQPDGWHPVDDGSEALTLTADQLHAHLPPGSYGHPGDPGYGYDPQYGVQDPGGYGAQGYGAQEYQQGEPVVEGGGDYGLVPYDANAGQPVARSWSPPSYSILRINPAEHVDSFSPDLVLLSHPDGYAAGQFRTLRYRLEQEPDLQVIVVTSARDGEGKSVTAANLALALAEGGRMQVLLIDASLRSPAQHRLFGVNGDLGLTSVLAARQNDPSLPVDVIRITASLNLIPAGPAVASAHAALSSEAAAVLVGQLRREFRYIIVDSAAVFGTAETLAWHGLVDKYIVVARAGHTTTEDLSATVERLQKERIVGVTFVGMKKAKRR